MASTRLYGGDEMIVFFAKPLQPLDDNLNWVQLHVPVN
jgi:hypothetical protein